MKKHFLTGLVILLPFVISAFVFMWALDLLTAPFLEVTTKVLPLLHIKVGALYAAALSRLLALLFLLGAIFLLGFLGSRWLLASILEKVHLFFSRIPGLRVLFNFTKEVISKVFDTKGPTFDGSGMVPFPQDGLYAMGLFSDHVPKEIKEKKPELNVSVFVTTAPHPISGFVLLMKKEEIKPLPVKTDEVFKFQISCGILSNSKEESCPK